MEIYKLVFTVIFSAGILFGIIFSYYLKFYKKYNNLTSNYLNWFLIVFTLNNIQILLVDNFVSESNCYIKNLHPFLFFVFVVPLFHSFIINYLQINDKVKNYLKPALFLFTIGMLARILLSPLFTFGTCNYINNYVQLEEIAIALLSVFVFFKVVLIVFFKKQWYTKLLSYDKLKWIYQFLFLGAIVLGFWIFAIVFNLKNYVDPKFYVYYPLRISSTVLLYWVGYTGSFKSVLTIERQEIRQKIFTLPILKSLENKNISEKFKQICNHLEKTNCFLDSDYSLEQFAKEVSINKNSLSDEINRNAKQNFNDFINSYRVKKAKLLLKNPDYNNYTVDAIGLECGFNSKSTFYAAFKKVTNTTPATYKKIDF